MQLLTSISPRQGLRLILTAQLLTASVLLALSAFDTFSATYWEQPATQFGPVVPGNQRRDYRIDKPALDPARKEAPEPLLHNSSFPERLTFSERTSETLGGILLLAGAIEPGDAGRLEAHLAHMTYAPDIVALHSPGGSVSEAQAIGRLIRRKKLSTAVLAQANCLSSCPYVLAGGEKRIVSLRGIVGMHQHYYEQPRYLPVVFAVEAIQASQGKTMDFLIEMGVEPSLMLYSLKTPPEQIYALVEEELIQTQIATEIIRE